MFLHNSLFIFYFRPGFWVFESCLIVTKIITLYNQSKKSIKTILAGEVSEKNDKQEGKMLKSVIACKE